MSARAVLTQEDGKHQILQKTQISDIQTVTEASGRRSKVKVFDSN